MKKGLWIYLFILVMLATVLDYFILKTNYIVPDNTKSLSLNSDRYLQVSADIPQIDVITASSGHYRIRSGDTILEGEHLTGDYFQKTAQLPVGKWVHDSGGMPVSITITSPFLVLVVSKPTVGAYIGYIFMTLFIGAGLFFVGFAISKP